MKFNNHYNLEGHHAPFSASKSSWLRYDEEKLLRVYQNMKAAEMGTKLHEWAKNTIDLGIKQSKSKKTICTYVNDAIGYKMDTEVVLYYSEHFFGTADAISFRQEPDPENPGNKIDVLRIHDLKTGNTPVHMEQLMIYAALFCLEYKIKPGEINMELRIYQNDEVIVHTPSVEEIAEIMDKIITMNKLLERMEGSV